MPRVALIICTALLAMPLAACGGATTPAAPARVPTMAATNADEVAAGTTGTEMELPGFPPLDPPIPLFEVVAETADTLTIRHLRGEAIIPRNPPRIVTSLGTAEILISLGIMPVGYAAREDLSPVVRAIAPDVTYLPVVDSGPNLEQLAALQPDLIIGYSFIGGQNPEDYELINQIAPTVVFNDWPAYYWQDATRQIAALFDKTAEAETVITDYEQRVAEIRERIAPVIGDETISPILFFDTPWLYGPMHFAPDGARMVPSANVGWLYRELQLTPAPEVARFLGSGTEAIGDGFFEITSELLPEIKAAHLVVFPGGYSGAEEISEGYEAYTSSLLWQSVPAVQQGNVYEIVGVNRPGGYYSLLDVMERFAEAVTQQP